MIEAVVSVLGICLIFVPGLMYFRYLMVHVKDKTKFDYHLELVNDKKGKSGVFIAYFTKILFGLLLCFLGILMSEFFTNESIFIAFVVTLVLYIILRYFDEKNEK